MKLNALEDLFVRELSELYGSESLILKALPKMIKAASDSALKQAFVDHKAETKDQVSRLERIFKLLDEDPIKLKSYPVSGALDQGAEMMKSRESDSTVVDAGLLAAAQKVEHYEIASYGAVHTHAALLGYEEAADLLATTLKEEHAADARLTAIAKESVNSEAAKAPYGRARTGTRTLSSSQSREDHSAGRLLIGLSIGAAIAFFLGSSNWRKGQSALYNSSGERIG